MTEFKQIIGRGTRINEDYGKYWFTIMDFKKATELFADKDFDGEPVVIFEPKDGESPVPPDDIEDPALPPDEKPDVTIDGDEEKTGRVKYVVGNVAVHVVAQRVQYYGPEGKLITESIRDYTRNKVQKDYQSLDDFLKTWTSAERKAVLIQEFESHGILLEALAEEVGKDFDPFDLVCHVAFDQPPLTRKERAEQVKKRNYFAKYGAQAKQVLEALLDKYADTGVENIEDIKILTLDPFKTMGSAPELISAFGGKQGYLNALKELEQQLYA
jgi:type I restriction enzyme R subunit